MEVCEIQTLICGLNLEEMNSVILSPSLPHIRSCEFLSDSGLYIISCELVRHFTASLENEEVVNKIIIRPKSCAIPPGVGCSSECHWGGRGDLCCSIVFSSIKD